MESTITISLRAGWNWVSLNIEPTDTSINRVVSATPPSAVDDLVKSATAFSLWDGNEWKGSLNTWTAEQTHLIKMRSPATFTVTGAPITSVPVNPGWNWIAFAHPTDLPSLATVSHSAGFSTNDLLKSSTAFSMWGANGFVGSLTDLSIGKGYLLKCARGGTVSFGAAHGRRVEGLPKLVKPTRGVLASEHGEPPIAATTAALVVSLIIDGALTSAGSIAAFSAAGALLGAQTAHANGKFYLSVAGPLDDAAPHRPIHFKHTDERGTTHDLDGSYKYVANELVELQLTNVSPSPPSTIAATTASSTFSTDHPTRVSTDLAHMRGHMMTNLAIVLAVVGVAAIASLIALTKGVGKRTSSPEEMAPAVKALRAIPEHEAA
jgi:hypothetical protein